MNKIFAYIIQYSIKIKEGVLFFGKKYRAQSIRFQIILAIIVLLILGFFIYHLRSSKTSAELNTFKTVTLIPLSSLSGNKSSLSTLGTVRSISEAKILTQSSGTIRSVNARVGSTVRPGAILAETDNASEAAVVLQAQGAYEGALASRSITNLSSGNSSKNFEEAKNAARSTYRSSYTTLDTVLHTNVDTFFSGVTTGVDPAITIQAWVVKDLPQRRHAISDAMDIYQANIQNAEKTDPEVLLTESYTTATNLSLFLTDLARAAQSQDSGATQAQLSNLGIARASIDGLLQGLSGARDAYRGKKTAATIGSEQSTSTGAQTASADAQVKQALGALRGAQAILERTRIRSPLGGTINFFPIRVGEYVTPFTHVATVAQNGALEVVSYVSEADREKFSVGEKVFVEETIEGIVTSIAPALDPITKQTEVHVGISGKSNLVTGSSVRITSSAQNKKVPTKNQTVSTSTPLTLLPLSAVKLRADARVIFTVNSEGRLVAQNVAVGQVRGETIEVTTPLDKALLIVGDARGLAEGERVTVATTTRVGGI
jgi:multidrug resistance efflux pump